MKKENRCRECGTTKDVEEVYDPFKQEVEGEDELVFLCPDCEALLLQNADEYLSNLDEF